ncbi:MAG: class I SAM-dependent methyltransferase [Nanoarchaeota archaeon]|nr:class I SAM-dependent methyltransferase [Nanoarchaeota archaeon]
MVQLKEEFQLSEHLSLDEYDGYMKHKPLEQRIILDFVINRLKEKSSLKIIEFGAGTGRFTKLLLNIFPKLNLILVEPDKNCCLKLNKLKKKYPQIKIVQSTAENYKSKEKFDIVIMATAFHHVAFKNKSKVLKLVKSILNKNGMFLCGDNFIAEYKNMKERDQVLKKSMDKWIRDAKRDNDVKEIKMAQDMQKIVFRKDYGGEYFICPSKFEAHIKEAKLTVKGKVNVTNTDPLDMEKYFYLVMR